MTQIVRLTVIANPSEAEVICSFLRSEGIPCMLGPVPGDLSESGMGNWQEIFVGDVDLERARELLESRSEN